MKVIQNGTVLLPNGTLRKQNVIIENGIIKAMEEASYPQAEEVYDASDFIVAPGFVDIHIHGADGADFSDGEKKNIDKIAEYLLRQGVTAFLGTTMSLDEHQLIKVMNTAEPIIGKTRNSKAVLWGINLEGPFIAKGRKGGQNEAYIRNPDHDMFTRLFEKSGGSIKIVDIAPELEGGLDFIVKNKKRCRIALAHTDADYDMAKLAFAAGATHITHLFNAMTPMNHRNPGMIVAAMEDAEFVELICDGRHIHPAVIRLTFQMFGKDRICIISDCMRACGMKNGQYDLGGQTVYVSGDMATLEDGTLAGSTTNAAEGVRRAIKYGIPVEEALLAATINPARAAGLEDKIGSLCPGKRADIILLDKNMNTQAVFLEGEYQKFK